MNAALVIPFRDRGLDPYRPMNLDYVLDWWESRIDFPILVLDDGRGGQETFNRSAVYNRAVAQSPDIDVFIFSESDVFCTPEQLSTGMELALEAPGLVVPFSRFLELSEAHSAAVRGGADHLSMPTEQIRGDYEANGAINIISRETHELVGGYDESFSSAWYDDTAMGLAFDICCGPTRFVEGNVHHLFHASGGRSGAITTEEDRIATENNRLRFELYRQASTPEEIRKLTSGE